jgi:hypothetical protein
LISVKDGPLTERKQLRLLTEFARLNYREVKSLVRNVCAVFDAYLTANTTQLSRAL